MLLTEIPRHALVRPRSPIGPQNGNTPTYPPPPPGTIVSVDERPSALVETVLSTAA